MGLSRLTHTRPEVTPEMSVREVVKVMAAAEIGAIAVMRDRRILGVFTERDLLTRVVAGGRNPDTIPIKDVMTAEVVTVADSASVNAATALMRERRIRHLVVVDDQGRYLGLLAQRHLLYDKMGELASKVEDLTGYLMADSPGG
jgi:CBS domain-containing protein